MNSTALHQYMPVSQLVADAHDVPNPKFPVFDFHTHFGTMLLGDGYAQKYETGQAVSTLKQAGISGVVNLDGGFGEQTDRMLEKIGAHGDFIHTFGTVDLTQFERPDFDAIVYRTLRDGKRKGLRGIKIWKILGLSIRGGDGAYLRPDDKRLSPVWQYAAEEQLPVLIHLADPKAFFLPIDGRNERLEELEANPEWSFCDEKYYSFDALQEMQDRLIAENPKTTFVVAHVGSYAENLNEVSRRLSLYPNMYVDIAERIAELGRQPYTAKAFLEKYADRVLFGTDSAPLKLYNYPSYYRFLETMDEYFEYEPLVQPPRQGRWRIYGVGLSDETLRKIYMENAHKLLGGLNL